MNYLSNSFKYFFKNFFRLALLLLPAAFLVGFFMNVYFPITFLKQFSLGTFASFGEVISFYFNSFKGLNGLYVVLTFIVLILSLSFAAGAINYHMRTGKFSFKEGLKQGLSYLLPIFLVIVILTAILALLNFVGSSIMLFLHSTFGELGSKPNNFLTIIGICLFSLVGVVYLILGLIFILSINAIVINGYTFKNALSRAVNLIENKLMKILAVILVPFLVIIPCIVFIPNLIILKVVLSLLIFLQSSFYIVLIFNFYFEANNMARNDLSKVSEYYKKR